MISLQLVFCIKLPMRELVSMEAKWQLCPLFFSIIFKMCTFIQG